MDIERKKVKKQPQLKYNISRLRDEDIVNINMDSGPLFIASLGNIQKCCSRGGTKQNRKPVTYKDLDQPLCVARIAGRYRERDVTTSFSILKWDIYNCGYCFEDEIRIGSNWTVLDDARVIIEDADSTFFGVSYTKCKKSKDNSVNHLKVSLGRDTLLSALYYLKYGRDEGARNTAFHSICYHLSEPSRLQAVATKLLEGFLSPIPTPIGDLRLLFNEWKFMCWCHRQEVLEHGFESLKSDLQARVGDEMDTFRKLDEALVTILFENEEDRHKRRMLKLETNKSKVALSHYRNKVPTKDIKQLTAKVHRNWTTDELAQHRKTELERLIIQGIPDGKGRADIWICLEEACREPEMRYKRLKIDHTDVNLRAPDLSDAYDDNGSRYRLGGSGEPKENEYMLCDPLGILP